MSNLSDNLLSALQGASNAAASNVSGPVDALAWALRKVGVPVPSNAFGGSEWMRQQGLTADPRNRLAGLLGEGVGLAAPFAIAAKAPQIAGGLLKADDALAAGANRMADHFERTGAAYRYDPKQRGAFMGANSKTWDAAANAKAAQMEAAGADPRAIWKETGNWKGPDGKWRQEIDDSASKFVTGQGHRLGDYLPHSKLYRAYPDMKKQFADIRPSYDGIPSGVYLHNSNNPVGVAYTTPENARSIGMHEIQHGIQAREGFAKGGGPEAESLMPFVRKFYADNIDNFQGESHELLRLAKNRAYRNLAGEAEARAVQSRLDLTAKQRRALFPADSYDVPIDKLILRDVDVGNSLSALAAALKGPR